MNRKSILLVEDSPDDEALTLRALRKNNILNEVAIARDGQQALDYFFDNSSSSKPLPSVVLLDLKLPKFDGFEVLRRIRTDQRTCLQPVVILTSSNETQDILNGYRLGANSYIRKPVDYTQFIESISQISHYWLTFERIHTYTAEAIMMTPLRVLIVEDSEADAELLLRTLRRGGYEPDYLRVETREALNEALSDETWDIIVSDYAMPRFDGMEALKLTKEKGLDIPFIILSGSIGEEIAVEAMKAGAHDYLMKDNMARLLPAIDRELREMRIRLGRRLADATIHRLAYTDPITNLPNRARFRELVQEATLIGLQEQHCVALLLIDLDRFKDVNDTLGHDRGDILLQQVSLRLNDVLFSPDVVARLGGDEFGILLTRLAESNDVLLVVKKLLDSLEAPFLIDDIHIVVEASIGVATMPEHARDADTLLQRADIAMYRAKQMGSVYSVYEAAFNIHSPERLGLMAGLRYAIERNQLLLHFQPKVDLLSGSILSVEALVRWNHPQLGMIPPDDFIPDAEKTGLITPLTRWVLTDALHYCSQLQNSGIPLRMSVNLSARSLHDPHLLKLIEEALSETGTQPEQLILEVTESAIVLDPVRAQANLVALNQLGVWLSIDDFGTGYTSLANIKRLPVNEIKIDRSFVTNMLTDKQDAMIVRTVIELGHNFDLTVVAEGVETKEVLDGLVALGCDEVQGYFISKPQPRESLNTWLSTTSWKSG